MIFRPRFSRFSTDTNPKNSPFFRLTVEEVLDRYGRDKIGMPDNSQFVMPKAQMDDLVARTGGDVGKLEQALGIPEGAWTNREMVQINIATPRDFNVRMPSGNEMGANNLWLPGGRLPTGQLEAVVDQIPKGGYTESLLPQAGKNVTPSNAPALNLAPAGHGMKPVTNSPAPATPVKAHTSANQANQGSHPIADPGASPTVKRAINALQEGSPDTRIGKTELQFREAVEGAKGVGVANEAAATSRMAELQAKWGRLSLTKRSALLEVKAEANALRRLQEMESATPNAHYLERHGAQLDLQSQFDRAAYGLNPTTGAQQHIPPAATRFMSHRDQLNVITKAESIYRATGDITQAQMPIRFDSVVGSGYQRGSLNYGVQYSGQVYLNSSGKAVSAFPVWGQ